MNKEFTSCTKKLCIYTGNILNLNEVKKKVGQKLTEELKESVQITINDWFDQNAELPTVPTLKVHRKEENSCSDLRPLGVNEERKDLKIGVKVFLPKYNCSKEAISEAISYLLAELKTSYIDSLILSINDEIISTETRLKYIETIWEQVEKEIDSGRILNGGLSEIDTELFIKLYDHVKVKPSIVQINLANCCVVPPILQEFAKENHIQLFTHSDSGEVLSAEQIKDLFGTGWHLNWVLRTQIHVKCRGVLASKCYMVCVERDE